MLPFRRGAAWQTLFLLCALAYCINEASSEGRVVCYYTNWSVYRPGTAKFNPQNINPYLCTHLVYAFGGFTKDNQMKPFDKYQDIEQGGYAKFTGLKTYNKQLKTMIAIGGWNEASSRFSPLVASNERRQQFIKNILKFLRQNHFDGIDLDWEYPAHREGGKSRDRDNYAQFVQELRAEFEREAEKTGRTRLLLTMAVPAGIEYIDKGYDVPKLNKYLDWFNVLTYDFHSSHEPSVNHHAPLYSLEEDSEYNYDAELNIDYSIKYYLKAGADRDKLVLGIPTYGRSYTLINEESTELGAPAEGPGEQGDATREKGYLAYYEICQTLKDDPEWTVVQPNANVMGPYAYRRNQWVGYDDEAIVRKKAEYVVAQGLGGIMFWAIDNDDFRGTCNGKPYPLIEAAKEAMVEALGLGINEVAKPSGPQKPSRSRSRDNANTRNRLNGKTEAPPSSRRPSATRRPTVSSTQPPPPSTTFKLTEAEGSSLYIGGRASTTPPPPTTPDPGSDFKCEEEGFFQHPRDCKKYYWCLDSGPSGLGIVAHMFTCPSGLYFNPAADSCDFARNVPCKTKKSTTVAPVTSTTPTTTTVRSNRVTAAPTARPVYPRTTTTTSTTTTTTTTTPASVDEDLEYEEDTDELSPSKSTDAEEDPQVIKELIDLIRKVGGVEQLEKHLLRNKDGSITLKENSATGAATTPSTISKSLYDRVLSRPGTLNSFSRNRFKISEATETSTEATASSSSSKSPSTLTSNSNSKYSSVLRGNSRQGPQNEGIEKLAEFDGFLKERKQYVTINRHRSASQGDDEELADQQEEEENLAEVQTTTRRPLSSITPSYTSLRRARPTTVAPPAEESNVEAEQHTQTQVKSYATLSRTRGRTTAPPEVTEAAPSSTTNRYKYFERTRPTKSAAAEDSEDPTEDEEEEYEDEQKDIVTVQSKQTTNTRKYASIGRRTTTTTTATPETTTTTAGTETAKASTTTTNNNNNNNNNNHYNSSNNNNNAKLNNQIPTEENISTTPSTTAQSETTTTTNETTEPNESTSTTTTSITNNLHTITTTTTTTTPTPIVASTVPTTTANGISSDSLLATELSEASPTHLSPSPDLETSTPTTTSTTTTTTEPELDTTTTTPKTTPTTTTTTGNNELNDVNNVDEDSEVTKTKTQYKYATTNRRRITTTTTTTNKNSNNNNNNAEAANDASPTTTNGLSSLNSIRTNPGRRQPPQSEQTQTTTTEPNLSSPRPFGYPRRRTRPTASTTTTTIPQTDNDNNTDNNVNETDAVAQVVKKTRLSPGDRPKVSASLPTATAINTRTNTSPLHHQESQVEVAGNGGNDSSLRHDVVSSSLSQSQSQSNKIDANDHSTTQQHTKYIWRGVRGPVSQRTVIPNSLAGDDKDSRRFAGKQLNTETIAEDELQTTTKFRSRRLNSAEDESEVALEVATATPSPGSRTYQSIQRSASKASIDDSQIHYKAITRDSVGGAHLTAGRSSSFVRNVGEAAKPTPPSQPISRGGQIVESTTEDENVAAEIIDDERRGETKAPAGSENTDDSNTATEQESPEIATEAAPPQLEITTLPSENSDVSSSSEASVSSTTEESISSTEELKTVVEEANEHLSSETDKQLTSENDNEESSTEISSSEAPVSSTTVQSKETETNSEASDKEIALNISAGSSEAPASSTEFLEISTTTSNPVILQEDSSTTGRPRRPINRFSSTTPAAAPEEETTSTVNPRRRVIVRTRTSTTEAESEAQTTTEGPRRRSFYRTSTTAAPSSSTEADSEAQISTEGPTRRSFFRTRTTEAASSTTEAASSTVEELGSPTEPEIEVETTSEGPTRRSFFRSSTTVAPSSTTEEISSSSVDDDVKANTITTRRSLFNKQAPSSTEATTTTTAEGSDVSSTTRRSFFRTSTTTEGTTSTAEDNAEKDIEHESETTTALPKRRVIVRGNFRPRKEGDLSSLLAADANKRARNNHSTTSTETPASQSPTFHEEDTETQQPQAEEKTTTGRASLNAVRNRTTTKTESLGNGITRTRTTYVRTLDAGQKVVKRIHTKTIEEKPAEYEYIIDEVTHPPPPSTTPRTVTRNRGSVRFQSNDLSSLLALDFASRNNRKKQAQTETTVTKTRRRLLKKPKETIEHEEVEEFEYEAGQEAGNEVEEAPRVSTTARTIIRRTRPTTVRTTTETPQNLEASTRRASFAFKRPSKVSTTTEEPTTTSTEPTTSSEATTRRVLAFRRPVSTTTESSPSSTEDESSTEEATAAPFEATTRRVLTFKRPVSTTTTPAPIEEASTEESTTSSLEGTTRRVLAYRRPVSTTTTTPVPVEDESSDQLAAAKQKLINRLKSSTTTTTTTPETTTTEEDLSELKVQLSNAINRLQTENKLEGQTVTKESEATEDEGDDKLSLPIYHRRKYYQYVKDSPITYIDKSPAPPDIESVTVNIKQQIHDVFNVSENETPLNSLADDGETEEHREAMAQAKEINAELGHFLLKTPGSKTKSQRQGKTFKTIPLATDSSNETSKIVSLSLLEEKERGEDEARALRTYTRLNRTRLTLSTRLPEKKPSEPLDTTTRRSYSVPQRFRLRSTTPIPSNTENSEEDEEETKDNEGPSRSTTTATPSIKIPTRRLFTPRRPVSAVEESSSTDIRKDNDEEFKVESTTRRLYAGLNRLRGRGSTTTTTEEATDSTTEAATTTAKSTRQPYVGISRRVTTTTTTEKSAESSTEYNGNEDDDAESTTITAEQEVNNDAEGNKVAIKEAEDPVAEKAPEETEVDSTEEPELEAYIDDDNEIPQEESGHRTETTSTTTTTTTSKPASTTSRRQLVIRRRFNGTITRTTTVAPLADDNLENEIEPHDTESSRPKAATTTPPRRQLLIRRRFNATSSSTTTTTANPIADNEIDQAGEPTSTTRRTILSRRRFNATSITTTTTPGSTNGDEISTRRPYAALNRSRNRFTTPRTTTTDGAQEDDDDDDDDDDDEEEKQQAPPRAVFLQTNRHRALKPTPEEEEDAAAAVPARKPPNFAARRTTAAPLRVSSSTRRNLVAINRNLYHRAEEYDEEQPEEEYDENEEGDDDQEETVDPQVTSTTARTRLSQLLANRQRQPLRTTTQKPTETESSDTETDADNEDENDDENDDEDNDSSAEVSNSNHTLNHHTNTLGGGTTNPNNLTNRSTTALNVASQRSNSTVANYINRFKSNSYTIKNKPVTVTANIKADSTDKDNHNDNDNDGDNDVDNDDDHDASLENEGEEKTSGAGLNALGNDVNSTRRFQNRYQLSRTRGSTTNTTPTTATTTTQQQQQPQTTTTARRLTFGGRQRAQVTKLTLVDEQTEETETKGVAREEEEKEEEEDSNATTTTSTTTTTTSRPTPKRIRVLKFRRPLNSNSNSTTSNVDSTTNSATDTNPDTTTTATPTTAGQSTTTSNNNNTTSTTGNKRFRKIVRKLRPVDSSTAASVDNSDETTRKPFVPSHTRFADQDNDLVNLRQRIKEQQARGEPQDGVISSRFKTLGQKDDQDVSELQKLRDKVKAEQARGEGERGVINDRLKKLLAEKGSSISSQREESSTDDDSSSVSSARPFFKRKLVARRPYTPPSASGGGTTKAPLTFSTTRPTAKFVRRKNGRFDPFNSSVRNRGEGFVRSDPRGSRLPGTDRFKSQGNNEDDEEVEERREQPLQNQFATTLRRPFVPKTRPVLDKAKPQQEDGAEDSEEEDEEEDSEEDGDEEEDEEEEEEQKEKPEVEEENPQEDNKPTINSLYKPKDNRAPPGSRPTFGTTGSGSPPTASGNVPFNPRNRPSSSANANNTPSNRFGTTKRPRVVNRPPGVASPNLTLKPVASDYERTTPLTPLKPAPFIPSNNRSYERKYSGPSTEAAETSSENSLIEDLNIDALNARNKKIFDKHSKKHPALKPKVVKVESETGLEVETGTEVAVEEETTEVQQLEQGFVTTTPSTPPSPAPAPPSTQSDTATTTDTPPETKTETEPETEPETETEIETETENVTEIETATNANEATSVNSQDQTISSTTQAPPPATTLLHVFTLLEGEGQEEEPTTRKPTVRLYPTIQTEVVPKHKLVEINRIVEINSKQAKASQRKSKANNDFGVLMVESLPHVEQLGEISVVKYVHLVDGSDIQINDGHSTVADYTPTEPTSAAQGPVSLPVRNSLPETEGADTDRSGKSLVPEVLTAALETSTISLEGLFDSARKGKQLSSNTIIGETEESTTIGSSSSLATETGETTTPAPTYLRQPATGSVSRRPVLSVRRRIINSPTLAAVEATTTQQPAAEPPTTTSKYSRLRSRPSATAAAAAATTVTAAAATTAFPAATSAPGGRTTSNIYLSKLKAKSGAAAAAAAAAAASGEAATLTPATSNISSSNSNDITQKQHKFQPASFALRRQFQTRRLTTFAPAANGDESATEVPRTQNPLFKRRLTLISTTPPSARTTNPPVSGLDTTTTLYVNDDDEDQVAKSSIHTSRFNQIPEQVRPSEEYDLALAPQPLKSTSTTASTTVNAPQPLIGQGIRRQLIPRPRRPQSTTSTPSATLGSSLRSTTPVDHSAPPLSRRQQSRRRPHKYIEVYSRPPAKTAVVSATSSSQFLDEELPPVGPSQVAQRRRSGSILPAKNEPKVIVHGHGIIECRAQGNFPHPLNCRKFISCARFEETGGIVGWEYTCPKGLTYDGVGGMCTWSPSDQPCRD
ncbi:serine-rich adhesin for platelets isoform X5 [Drosophila santomea]|uniref:serine-rich adhesin for platelets isoform X5 n=1 Tax=Drosophila santomea TaxID=129105 RepID=UPI00195408DB|nr:serine-rich adhesin for platelets isoform X5 [Drosophila santomea]